MKTTSNSTTKRSGDLILQELWRVKDERSAARGHDIHRLFAEARERQKFSSPRSGGNVSKSGKV